MINFAQYLWRLLVAPDGLISAEIGVLPPSQLPQNVKMTFDSDNRIATLNGDSVSYDVDGNVLSIPAGASAISATFDAAGRLTVAGNVTSSYDPEGRRTKITDANGESNLVYDTVPALDRILVRTNPDGSVTKYVYGTGLLYEVTGSTLRAYHYDSRGSTLALTDAAGAVTDTFSYGPYGETWSRTGTTNTPLRFCGQYGIQTDMNGLLSMRARFYSPEIKRFVSQDSYLGSAMSPLSLNRYSYAECNPVSLIDPTGFVAMDLGAGISSGWTGRLTADSPTSWAFSIGQMFGGSASGSGDGMGEGIDNINASLARFNMLGNAADYMRKEMREQSLLDPRNASGISVGFRNDGFKLGGGRFNPGNLYASPSPLGGYQGGAGMLGVPGTSIIIYKYEPGSFTDRLVEAFAGPHDLLNSFYFYDKQGNISTNTSPAIRFVANSMPILWLTPDRTAVAGEIVNGMNVFLASPFVLASLFPTNESTRSKSP